MGSTKPCFTAAELAVSLLIYMYAYTGIYTHAHAHEFGRQNWTHVFCCCTSLKT